MKRHPACKHGNLRLTRNRTKWNDCRLCRRQRWAWLRQPMRFEQLNLFALPEECKEKEAA